MDKLIKKLNYKGQQRIALLNPDSNFAADIKKELNDVQVDDAIDPRFLYEFMLIFIDSVSQIEDLVPPALHNLSPDGILWFAYPKKTSNRFKSGPDRDHGWKSLNKAGFQPVRQISVDDDFTALRFRNVKFIKSANNSSE